ncbi:MAG: hypothetical protein ACREH9_09645, partial [Pseudomonadota bacterium]
MRQIALTALAATVLLASGMIPKRAAALTPAAPPALGIAAAHMGLARKAGVVCGRNSCVRRYRPGYGPYRYYRFYRPWGWSDLAQPTPFVPYSYGPYYGYYRPWGWSDVAHPWRW